jgi:hypothetical protein
MEQVSSFDPETLHSNEMDNMSTRNIHWLPGQMEEISSLEEGITEQGISR